MSDSIRILTDDELVQSLHKASSDRRSSYAAMYSSWWGGIVKEPALMVVPVDDHLVHRGDGVFEAFRVIDDHFFDLEAHLQRLQSSAERIDLRLPNSLIEIREICAATVRASGLRNALVRLYVSRGPGGFTANPYECLRSQLYVVVTEFKPVPESNYESGVTAKVSSIPWKVGWQAQVKSCNYLLNVLLKKDAVDSGCDFAVALNDQGHVCEGATENIALISSDGRFCYPKFDYTLKGTTLLCVLGLAQRLMAGGVISSVEECDISSSDFANASEVMMIGTTLEVLPVRQWDGQPVADGRVGPVARQLRDLLRQEMKPPGPRLAAVGR